MNYCKLHSVNQYYEKLKHITGEYVLTLTGVSFMTIAVRSAIDILNKGVAERMLTPGKRIVPLFYLGKVKEIGA